MRRNSFRPLIFGLLAVACLLVSFTAYAVDAGTPEEAKAMALRAADLEACARTAPTRLFPSSTARGRTVS